jgi:hypothetical protein
MVREANYKQQTNISHEEKKSHQTASYYFPNLPSNLVKAFQGLAESAVKNPIITTSAILNFMGQNLFATATPTLAPTSYASQDPTMSNINYEYNDKDSLGETIGVIAFAALSAVVCAGGAMYMLRNGPNIDFEYPVNQEDLELGNIDDINNLENEEQPWTIHLAKERPQRSR